MQTSNSDRKKRVSILLLFLTALLWSTGGVFIKLISLDPISISGLRSLFASIVFLPFIGNPFRIRLNKLKLFCALCYAGNVIFLVAATRCTTSANAILLQYTAPIYVILLSGKLLGEEVRKRDIYTVSGVLSGMIVFTFDGLTNKNLVGNLLGMLAGMSFAAVLLLTKKIQLSSRPDSPSDSSSTSYSASSLEPLFLGNLLTALLCSPFYLKGNILSKDLWMLLVFGILQLGVPYVIYAYASKYVSAVQTSLIITLEPILNPVWVFLATGELPSMLSLTGGLIVIASISASYMIQGMKHEKKQVSNQVSHVRGRGKRAESEASGKPKCV